MVAFVMLLLEIDMSEYQKGTRWLIPFLFIKKWLRLRIYASVADNQNVLDFR